jgi:carotenoid cleavage dioxygenase-like enzyme
MWKYNNNEKMMIVILLVISCLFVNMIPSYSAQVTKESFPSPPWVQKGNAYVQVFDVPLSVAKKCVPSDFNIVETKEGSGLTEGSLYIAKYNNQSTIEYSELIFICATVQYEGKKGNWVHAIYVDNEMAKDAGINVWGLPKKMATFEWDRNTSPELQHVVVKDATNNEEAAVIIDATFNDNAIKIPLMHQIINTYGISVKDTKTLLYSATEQKYGVKLLKEAILNVPSTSPLSMLKNSDTVLKTKVEMVDGLFNMTAPTSIQYITPSRASGYFETTPEVARNEIKLQGTIPKWLNGALLRNSPGKYENGNDQIRHWNDGWAQVHRWEINGEKGTVVHLSKYLNTTSFHKSETSNEYAEPGYGTPKTPGPRPHLPIKAPNTTTTRTVTDGDDKVTATITTTMDQVVIGDKKQQKNSKKSSSPVPKWQEKFASNPLVNLWKFDNKYIATTDENLFTQFDPVTLETIGGANEAWSDDEIEKIGLLGLGVAHGRYDRYEKKHYWLEFGWNDGVNGGAHYNVWTYQESGFNGTGPLPPRKIIGTVKDKMTSFIHSFGLTKKYVLLIQCPLHYHFLKFLSAKKVIDAMTWDDTIPVKFHILDRNNGTLIRSVDSADGAWFVYHILNAYDDGNDNIIVDLSKYQNDTLITYGMYLENLVDQPKNYVGTYSQARLTRCTVPVFTGRPTCVDVIDKTFEMATFNWVNYHMEPHRYTWGASFVDANTHWHDGSSDFIDQIIKVDIEKGEVMAKFQEDNVYVCEPLFVPNPNPVSEDDGALIFVGYNSIKDHSTLYILDGKTMATLGTADMPGKLAANFHGKFCPDDKDYCIGL